MSRPLLERPLLERLLLGVIVAGFGVGCITHGLDFWWFGFAPYAFGPAGLNLFWNALLLLDALVIGLLVFGWRRCGLLLALTVMTGDVAANSYAWGSLGIDAFGPALVAQAGMLGLLLGSAGFLWPVRAAKAA